MVRSDFSRSCHLTTGCTAKASSVSPLADLSPEIPQEASAIPVVVAPIPLIKSRRVQFISPIFVASSIADQLPTLQAQSLFINGVFVPPSNRRFGGH